FHTIRFKHGLLDFGPMRVVPTLASMTIGIAASGKGCIGEPEEFPLPGEALGRAAYQVTDLLVSALAVELGRRLVHRVADAPRVVIGEGPHATARAVDEAAPGRIEGINHREQHIAGDVLVRDPVTVATHAGELVRAVDVGHIDADQALVARQRLQVLARKLLETRPSKP